jgi:hypothetical protein
MSPALQGTRYLFSVLQHVLTDQPRSSRLRLSHLVKHALLDWAHIAADLSSHPMPIASLVPRAPHYVGAVDASGIGCGGFWVATHHGQLPAPIVFRYAFPKDISSQLVSTANPSGTITNSDFELAAVALGLAILQQHAPKQHTCAFAASDNTPTVAWCNKGSTSLVGANAHLLRWMAQLTRASGLTLKPVSVPGNSNHVADFCSQSFDLPDQDFLLELNKRFPTTPFWQLVHPTPETGHSMISALSCKMSRWHSAHHVKGVTEQPPLSGTPSVPPLAWTPPCPSAATPSQPYNSSPIAIEWATLLPTALKSAVKRWGTPFVPWGRRSPTWDSLTRDSAPMANSIYV